MKLTEEIFNQGKSSNGSWNLKQLQIFGEAPGNQLKFGWKKRIIGKDFPESFIKEFLLLKDKHLKPKIKIEENKTISLNDNELILSKEIIEQARSLNGGFNFKQYTILGITDRRGNRTMKKLIGSKFDKKIIEEFLRLKNIHLKTVEYNEKPEFSNVTDVLTYKAQYLHPNWQKLRLFILKRDNWKCINCLNENKTLHVHHKKYEGKYVWDTDPKFLETLCEECHSKEHGKNLTLNI